MAIAAKEQRDCGLLLVSISLLTVTGQRMVPVLMLGLSSNSGFSMVVIRFIVIIEAGWSAKQQQQKHVARWKVEAGGIFFT